jgi:hypothetical protein
MLRCLKSKEKIIREKIIGLEETTLKLQYASYETCDDKQAAEVDKQIGINQRAIGRLQNLLKTKLSYEVE